MSSRYPPPDSGDTRYPIRDRSPPRFSGRRSSTSYTTAPSSVRTTDANHRSFDANAHSHSGRDLPREPPRGPKAYVDAPRAGYPPRGRGSSGRGDFRDRDFRDSRDVPLGRGGRDRDWGHRTSTDRRISPPPRGRTRSPQRDYSWESRDFAIRDSDRDRTRRDPTAEPHYPVGYRGRGSYRGRGRGDWDYGHRGRGGHIEDRDGFHARSRSQDRSWDRPARDERERDRDRDHEPMRRDDEYRRTWDDKYSDTDKYRRDPPFRPDSRNSSATNPSTPLSATGPPLNQLNADRISHAYRGPGSDSSRRSSGPNSSSNYSAPFQRSDAPLSRSERDRFAQQPQQAPSSPPQAPQVPAFGSISYKPPATVPTTSTKASTGDSSTEQAIQIARQTAKQPPSAPKAQLLIHTPTAPRAEKHLERLAATDLKPQTNRISGVDRQPAGQPPTPAVALSRPKPFAADSPADSKTNPQTPSQVRQASENLFPRYPTSPSSPQLAERSTSLHMVHPSRREVIVESGRKESLTSVPSKQTHREISIPGQPSPAKVPTGPRADRNVPSIRQAGPPASRALSNRLSIPQWGRGQSNLTWVRPGLSQGPPQHAPRGPSIMNPVPSKRDNAGDEKVKTPIPELDDRDPFDSSWSRNGTSLKAALDAAKAEGGRPSPVDRRTAHEHGPPENKQPLRIEEGSHIPSSEELPQTPAKEGVEDASMDLDDDDYEVAERNFNREMQILEARRPPDPFRHPELLSLLEECNALASAAEDLSNGVIPPTHTAKVPSQTATLGLPSPKAEESEKLEMKGDAPYSLRLPPDRQLTPQIESLPFLTSGPPTPFSQIDDSHNDVSLHELVRSRIEDHLTTQNEQLDGQYEQTKVYFASCYRSWRIKNLELEEVEKARIDAEPPPVPDDSMPAIGTAIPSISGKNVRVMRNTSDLQMETALELSKLTAAEEAEKRAHHQAGDIGPNIDKEANIPDMLTEKESVASIFADRNNLIPSHIVLQVLAFVPKADDFTAEEHDKFVEHYILNPKRWGTIAELIPGRTYQDCVQHYYLTKGTCAYKEKERAFLRIKKGRRGPRGPQGRAKSSNLMPLYDGNQEVDPASTAVTETGRPKRTAAPVFGATSDVENAAPASTPLRNNMGRGKTEANGEPSGEKPKRRGGATLKEKGTRKGKAPLLAAAPGPSPQKAEKDIARGRSREPKVEMDQIPEDLEGAQLLAGLQNSHISAIPLSQHPAVESWMNRQSMAMNSTTAGPQKPQQPIFEAQLQPHEQRGGQSTTSSYWSVPEHQDFQNLLGYFGTNWQAIADTMKTKSVTMVNKPSELHYSSPLRLKQSSKQVRNYYNRESQKEGGDFFKHIAQNADEKIKRGDDMGSLPLPTVQTKRRNDAAPQLSAQRTLAPSIDHVDVDNETPPMQPSKPVQMSPPQVPTPQPRYQALAQAEAAPVPVFSQATSQGVGNTNSRQQQSSQQRASQLQGPRSGFFTDERPRPILQPQPPIDIQKHHQQQRQINQDDEVNRIRPLEVPSRTEALKRQQKQDFLDKLEQQHHIRQADQPGPPQLLQPHPRHTDRPQTIVQQHPSNRSQSTAVSQSFLPPSQSMSSQIRIAPSQPPEIEPRPRFSSHPQQPQLEMIKQENPAVLRRLDPNAPDQGRQSAIQSPSSGRIPLANPPLGENTRPNSISRPPSQPPAKPSPAPAKRSNIMSILNDEPSEPPPARRRPEDTLSTASKSLQQPPTQSYQPLGHPSQQAPPRDPGLDISVSLAQPQHRVSMSQSNVQQQQQQGQQQIQTREAPSTWVAAAQRLEQQRSNYQSPPVNSPRSQPMFLQQSSRGPFQTIQRSHAPSPPLAPFSHSRNSSYTRELPQHGPQPQIQSQPSKQASQVQAAPNLQPSPYATIQPHGQTANPSHHQQVIHSQQQARAQQEQMQRQLEEQRHQEMQRRARQEVLLQQDAAHQQQHQQYQQQQQAQELPRRQSEQSAFLRPKENSHRETDRHQDRLLQYQLSLVRQEQERRQEQTRREQGQVYTPPTYQNPGYGPPPPPSSQQQQPPPRGPGHGR
ncbi:MAG: hypothetical protein Q9170_003557 [Blastenia crenularia]